MAFVAQNLLDLAETNANAKHHRKTYTPEQIKEATDFGVVRGCAFAHNKTGVPLSSLKDWVAHFKCEQTKGEYFKPSKRGTKPLLTPTEELGVAKVVDTLRKKGTAVDSSLVGSAAMGIFEKSHSSLLLKKHGGVYCFSNFSLSKNHRNYLYKTGIQEYKIFSIFLKKRRKNTKMASPLPPSPLRPF